MKRKIFGLFIVLAAIVGMGCKSATSDTPTTNPVTIVSDKTISLLVIPGVVAPVRDAIPVTTIDTAQYAGTITWDPAASKFAASTAYKATIVLTAKAGWSLTGVKANSFTGMGAATVTNPANTGIVTAVFHATLTTLDYDSVNIGILKYVSAGTFRRDATATNTSAVSAFRMSTYEITRSQFLAIMGTDPSDTAYSTADTANPVQMTNWYHAIAFCNKLSLAEGLTPVYAVTGVDFATLDFASIPTAATAAWDAVTATWTNNGYRLPTEMEWMWAAMGATGSGTNTTGYLKAFAGSTGSNAIGDYAVFGYGGTETGSTVTTRSNPVGSKAANELGLYDMSGNIEEWNWDQWDARAAYPSGSLTDYRGASSGNYRVTRGGSWGNSAARCTVAKRSPGNPFRPNYGVGFRVVRP